MKRPLTLLLLLAGGHPAVAQQEMGEVSPSHDSLQDRIQRLARLAWDCGCDGLVCSPTDLPGLRAALGPEPLIVTPGRVGCGLTTTAPTKSSREFPPKSFRCVERPYMSIARPIGASNACKSRRIGWIIRDN